ncbi:MAG: hypothetical protein K6C14_06125 [Eubacterium sp.]|nr:hypothetical protein [Eubacterium sp.]
MKKLIIVLLAVSVLLLSACGAEKNNNENASSLNPTDASESVTASQGTEAESAPLTSEKSGGEKENTATLPRVENEGDGIEVPLDETDNGGDNGNKKAETTTSSGGNNSQQEQETEAEEGGYELPRIPIN